MVARVALLILVACSPVFAWSIEGHQIVALIAENRLTPTAAAEIERLLGKDSEGGQAHISDAEVCGWADTIKRRQPNTAPYHFVNIPFDADGYDAKRDDPEGDNLLATIDRFAAVLADRSKPDAERADALRFIVHLVGDLHQPLHCIQRGDDKGGGKRLVFFRERKKATHLHAVWDEDLIASYRNRRPLYEYCDELDKIEPGDAEKWQAGTPAEWAQEAHGVAIESAYRDIPADGAPPKIDQAYIDSRRAAVELQLRRGGVRLAAVLNRSLP